MVKRQEKNCWWSETCKHYIKKKIYTTPGPIEKQQEWTQPSFILYLCFSIKISKVASYHHNFKGFDKSAKNVKVSQHSITSHCKAYKCTIVLPCVCVDVQPQTDTHSPLLLAVVWEEGWKDSLWLGGQHYWPVDVWVESKLGFPTVSPSTHGLIPSVNNRSVPWVNKQELSCQHTKDQSKGLWGKVSGALFDKFFGPLHLEENLFIITQYLKRMFQLMIKCLNHLSLDLYCGG